MFGQKSCPALKAWPLYYPVLNLWSRAGVELVALVPFCIYTLALVTVGSVAARPGSKRKSGTSQLRNIRRWKKDCPDRVWSAKVSPWRGDDCLFGRWRDSVLILNIVCHEWSIRGCKRSPLVFKHERTSILQVWECGQREFRNDRVARCILSRIGPVNHRNYDLKHMLAATIIRVFFSDWLRGGYGACKRRCCSKRLDLTHVPSRDSRLSKSFFCCYIER